MNYIIKEYKLCGKDILIEVSSSTFITIYEYPDVCSECNDAEYQDQISTHPKASQNNTLDTVSLI